MKKLLIAVVVLSLAAVACEAFKDSYDQNLGPQTVSSPQGDLGSVDFSTDKTVCQAVAGVSVTAGEAKGVVKESVLSTAVEGAVVEAVAESLGAFTTRITVSAGEESVSFVIKQDEKGFTACSSNYKQMKIVKGEITVDTFNVEDVNAGTFSFEFASGAKTVEAVTAIAKLAGDPSDTVKVEGSYFVTGIMKAE